MEARKLFDDILFRGKSVEDGEWHYGLPCQSASKGAIYIATRDSRFYPVSPETLGEYIGVKDVYGNKIFEGDIVTVAGCEHSTRYIATMEVFWHFKPENPNKPMSHTPVTLGGEKLLRYSNIYDTQQPEAQAEEKPETASDAVNHPEHYQMGGVEVINAIEAWGFGEGFNRGNAIKYIARAGRKNPLKEVEDLKKAIFYIEREIKRLSSD